MDNLTDKTIWVTGGRGFLGTHLCEALWKQNAELIVTDSTSCDLRYRKNIDDLFSKNKIDIVVHLAADVGGIGYNRNHAYNLFYNNAMMGINLIDASIKFEIEKFVQIGTVCAYPKFCSPPFNELALWDGYPEETNAPYGLAKRMLLVQLQAARSEYNFNGIYLLPTNLYGPHDCFDYEKSHVIPALIRKFVESKDEVKIWGTGKASRDFLYVEDVVKAIILAIKNYNRKEPLNLGSGVEVRISTLVHIIQNILDYKGKIIWETSKPDGQPRRKLNINEAKHSLGWKPETTLTDGLEKTILWYKKQN